MFRRAFGVAIALVVALVLLFGLQGALINYHGRASMLGIPVGEAVGFVTRVASEIGRFIGWDDLKSIYWYSEGPAHRDPMTHTARPYWLGVIIAWVAVWVAIVALVWLLKSIAALLFSNGSNASREAGLFSHVRGPAGHPNEPWLWSYVRAGIPLPPVGGYPVVPPAAAAQTAAPSVVSVRYWHDHLVPLALIAVLVAGSLFALYLGAPRVLTLRSQQAVSELAVKQVAESCDDFLRQESSFSLNYAAACTGARAAIHQRPYAVEALFMVDLKLAEACGMYGMQGNGDQLRIATEMWAQGVDGCPTNVANAAQEQGLHRIVYRQGGGRSVLDWIGLIVLRLVIGAIATASAIVIIRRLRSKELWPRFNIGELSAFIAGTFILAFGVVPFVV